MNDLITGARALLQLELSPAQQAAFERYADLLVACNQEFNLTAITDPHGIEVKHFLDSLSALLALRCAPDARLIDVGSGAGFPGIPLKIICPHLRVTLVEATGKKAAFCRRVVDELGLQGVQVLHARAEQVGHDPAHREQYDWALARAVARMPVLLEYLLPLTRVGGCALAQKGEDAPAEAHAAGRALALLGGRLQRLVPVELPGVAETRYLVLCDKVASTPRQYPRRPGVPVKKPL